MRLETKVGMVFATLAVSVSALLTFALYMSVRTQLRQSIRQRLHDVVATASLTIDADAHATLTTQEQEASPTYARLKNRLQQCCSQAKDIRFAHTWHRGDDGKLTFVLDAEPDPNRMSHIGDVYDSGEPEVMAALAALDHVTVDDILNTNRWGVRISGYAPFYRSDGRMEGILSIGIKASDVSAYEHTFFWIACVIFGCTLPLALALGLSFGGRLAIPIEQLTLSTECIAAGDWNHRVVVQDDYETAHLAQSFNRMVDTIQEAMERRDGEIRSRKKAESALDALNRDLQATVERLSLANQELSRLATVTSHDLKTPLRGIKTLTDWIASDYAARLDEPGRECLGLLGERATRMFHLIDAVHRYVSIECTDRDKSPVDLHAAVTEVIAGLKAPPNVHLTIEGRLPIVHCYKDHITQLFQSLLGNAVKYIDKPEGRVTIRCTEESDCWQFSIADNGPGIAPRYHRKIFEIFQTLDSKDRPEDVGIGLSIAKKIVDLSEGRIWLESTPGSGSTFFFTLPRRPAVSSPSEVSPAGCAV
jgi:signal transduction histidine kinase